MVHSVYTKNPKLTRDRAVLEKIFFRLDFAAEIDYNITVLYGISRCVGMADEGDSKSLVLITRVGSTPTTGTNKAVQSIFSIELLYFFQSFSLFRAFFGFGERLAIIRRSVLMRTAYKSGALPKTVTD